MKPISNESIIKEQLLEKVDDFQLSIELQLCDISGVSEQIAAGIPFSKEGSPMGRPKSKCCRNV